MIKLAVSGSKGRMGSRIIALAEKDPSFQVATAFDIGEDAAAAISACDVLIEFTTPDATVEHVSIASRMRKGVVIGTTALAGESLKSLEEAAEKIPIVFSPNMSVGVNLMFRISSEAARVLPANYIPRITEAHHAHKKDAPSGTAKRLAEIVAAERNVAPDSIPIESIRNGEIAGDHKLVFEADTETLELTHSARTRDTFAAGALSAAKFLRNKTNGLYTMGDVLGI